MTPHAPSDELSIGDLAQIACWLEVSAPKPGNVQPDRGFSDTSWFDFAAAAAAIAPVIDRAPERSVGETVLDAVRATIEATGQNVNLGIILLTAPLAATRESRDPRSTVKQVLRNLGPEDCTSVYEAIRLASPGGLGRSPEDDVHGAPPADLIDAMAKAEDRDFIARQYARDFEDIFEFSLPCLREVLCRKFPVEQSIVHLHLELLRRYPDSLIARKCGLEVAREASRRAAAVLEAGWPQGGNAPGDLEDLDRWLRADGNRRNPGTTADVVAATLFLALRTDIIKVSRSGDFGVLARMKLSGSPRDFVARLLELVREG